jgi:uncharacterized protein YbjT (DUF2867 family)
MKIKPIITGVTGMIGEGVLYECLKHPNVEEVVVVTRKPTGISNPRMKEVVVKDFNDLSEVKDQLKGYDSCFFCAGVSSIGLNEEEYSKLTYDLTTNFARSLAELNPGMTFCYVSGAGTDSSEKGKSMWARVKGRTENAVARVPFKKVYNFRPGFIKPTKGLKNTLKLYTYLGWLYPVIKTISPNMGCSLTEIGQAMINSVLTGYDKTVIEVKDFIKLAAIRK